MSADDNDRPWITRHRGRLLAAPAIVLVIAAYIGDIFWSTLVNEHPVWLILLNTRTRYLVLVTNQLDAVTFYAVAFTRLVIADPLFYVIGLVYGDRGIKWLEHRTRSMGRYAREYETLFRQFSYPLVAIAPNNIFCALAGAARMKWWIFAALNAGGTIVRLVLIRAFGATFESPIGSVTSWVGRYQWPLLGISAAIVAWTIFSEFRSGRGDLEAALHLDELDEDPDRGQTPFSE
ncbi:MAG: hypothetical protein GY929_06745 [Actinomycetia bacterium]|nr:hypothetical protein [Actinomycetes bacterium]